jgi:hypothetical protein
MADQDRVPEGALPQQMSFVFARSEIDRREIFRRDLAIQRHRKGDRDEWLSSKVGGTFASRLRAGSGH